MSDSCFKVTSVDGAARCGVLTTPHGVVHTPAFMPVGSSGAVKALTAGDLEECGIEVVLGNAYHLYLRPGTEIVKTQGGLARFTGWNKPTLTDSGGYQVFSMRDISRTTDEGVEFKSHLDGSRHFFTPEKVMQIEHDLGADVIMTLDECVPYPTDRQTAALAVKRTTQWAQQCLATHAGLLERSIASRPAPRGRPALGGSSSAPMLWGIVQGSVYKDLRTLSAEQIVALELPGCAIGGLSVGETKQEMEAMVAHTVQYLPAGKPRYLMGVGYPEDILMAVSHGIDIFDCVLPTRNARTGNVFTSSGQLTYRNADFADDNQPLDPNCDCKVCRRYSRAYIRHLYNQSEITGMVLATYHSTYFYQNLMRAIRNAIAEKRLNRYRAEFLAAYGGNSQTNST
ncbi:MAG TPA: tRNA guanosine(34) transglycosylase Tgt [Candidatus Deferrimicrobium sp.]|nr:tRNA guanosine(34) transglycosylase Tgt [Candidatus Deferrimicrobium sp.]